MRTETETEAPSRAACGAESDGSVSPAPRSQSPAPVDALSVDLGLRHGTLDNQPRPAFGADDAEHLAQATPLLLYEPPGQAGLGQVGDSGNHACTPNTAEPTSQQEQQWRERVAAAVCQVPSRINAFLRPYQREGVQAMARALFRTQRTGFVLADDMGLGKTVQVLALVAAILGKTGDPATDLQLAAAVPRGSILIICPTSVLYNWEQEAHQWAYFSLGLFQGARRAQLLPDILRGRYEVVLANLDSIKTEPALLEHNWLLVVVDECHALKNDKTERYRALARMTCRRRLGLSGTVFQNNFREFWAIFNWVLAGAWIPWPRFKREFQGPIVSAAAARRTAEQQRAAEAALLHLAQCTADVTLKRYKSLLSSQLPVKQEKVVFCKLTPFQMAGYQRFLRSDYVEALLQATHNPCRRCGASKRGSECCYQVGTKGCASVIHLMFPVISVLRQLSNHPALLLPRADDDEVVRAELSEKVFEPEDPWMQSMLRNQLTSAGDTSVCGKLAILMQLLARWEKEQLSVVIFSYTTRLLNIIQDALSLQGRTPLRIDGQVSARDRHAVVAKFQARDERILLVSTHAGGEGINLQAASKVVIVDPCWNPARDLQAQDRAYRLGTEHDVEVLRLVTAGTLEELVYARQVYKLQLARMVQTGRTTARAVFDVAMPGEGELFGLENMLAPPVDGSLLEHILE
ncbi:uncharacterized protein MONBRDRAFT_14378, partial [Monosiga brevicollis MX1]